MELFSDTVCPAGSLSHQTVGISRKLIAVNSLIEKPRLYCPGCHPFRDLSGLSGSPSIISRWLWRYLPAPNPQKRLLPIHSFALWFCRGAGFGLR